MATRAADPRCDAFRGNWRARRPFPLWVAVIERRLGKTPSLAFGRAFADATPLDFKQINDLGRGSRRLSFNVATKEQAERVALAIQARSATESAFHSR